MERATRKDGANSHRPPEGCQHVRRAARSPYMRVCHVSHRLGGFDGVSVEAAKWVAACRGTGWQVTRAAGYFLDHEPDDVTVRGLWADRPGGDPPPVDHATVEKLCATHDLLILDNVGTLNSAPAASRSWQLHALSSGIPTIVRHHDPPWQSGGRRPADAEVPLHDPAHMHVVINDLTWREYAERWPDLARAGALRRVYNRVNSAALAAGDRDGTRRRLRVRPDEVLIVHPARAGAERKDVPAAVRFSRELGDLLGRPVRYWLTDDTPELPARVASELSSAPGLLRGHVTRQGDMYAAADLVILPSRWEGWGLPVIEASMAGKPVVAGPYPVLQEIRAAGLTVHDPSEVALVAKTLQDPRIAVPMLRENRRVALDRFDLPGLTGELHDLAHQARTLRDLAAGASCARAGDVTSPRTTTAMANRRRQ